LPDIGNLHASDVTLTGPDLTMFALSTSSARWSRELGRKMVEANTRPDAVGLPDHGAGMSGTDGGSCKGMPKTQPTRRVPALHRSCRMGGTASMTG
jgi:hypothetical protein